jgi:hypothetical protein
MLQQDIQEVKWTKVLLQAHEEPTILLFIETACGKASVCANGSGRHDIV